MQPELPSRRGAVRRDAMTTTTGEYAQLPSQFSALSIADSELPAENNGSVVPPMPRKPWRSPPTRPGEEHGSPSWPAPSRDGAAHGRRKPFSERPHEAAAIAASKESSNVVSAFCGDLVTSPADPRRPEQLEKGAWEEQRRTSESASVANNNPRPFRSALLPVPRQQQVRPPQNVRRGRPSYHHNNGDYGGNGSGNVQQRRPRQHWNPSFSQRQPPQMVNGGFYQPMNQPMITLHNLHPDWGFNTMPIVQWFPNPQFAPAYMGGLAPPIGSQFPEMFTYSAHPLSPMTPSPSGWNSPWMVAPATPPSETSSQNQLQSPAGNTARAGEDLGVKLRKQIEYYFSDDNLMKDIYLRKCMDDQGWVGIQTIANFPRVKNLTNDVGLILGVLQASDMIEVSVDKLRKKGEWSRWIIQQSPPNPKQEAPEG